MNWSVLVGDVRERLSELPAGSVQCCVTSPPYWGLRDYGHAGQLGLEQTPEAYVAALVEVFAGVWRVLKDDGTLWLNLGDSYAHSLRQSPNKAGDKQNSNAGSIRRGFAPIADGLKEKDLVGIPWMVAFALRSAGWYLRSDIIWSKPNPMPESVQDRPTKAHEYFFLLSKSQRYYYDAAAIAELAVVAAGTPAGYAGYSERAMAMGRNPSGNEKPGVVAFNTGIRNKRSVWTVSTQPYPEAHFATYPEALIEPCILAGSWIGDLVLDPFTGSGTTGAVAVKQGRSFVGVELNPAYAELARTRIGSAAPLFASEATA